MVEVMKIMVTSFKRSHAHTTLRAPDSVAGHCQPTLPPETPGPSGSLEQSLVGSLLLSFGSWSTQCFVCTLQKSVSPVLWQFCNQIPLASKVKFPGGSQSLCQIPRLANLLWVTEQCDNLFGVIVLQFVGHLLGSFIVGNGNMLQEGLCYTQDCGTQSPCP